MQFTPHMPGGRHADYLESVFHYSGFVPDHSIERVVPTGHLFVIFELDGFERHTYDNETLEPNATYTRVWISGVHSNYIAISAHDQSEMFVFQFKPYGGRPYLRRHLGELANRVVQIDEPDELGLLALREALLEGTPAEKFGEADKWLAARFDERDAPPDSLIEVIEAIRNEPAAPLADATSAFDASQKHLIDLFRRFVGITPKQFQRIIRFNHVFTRMSGDQFISWSEIAQLCGYSDQSHFIRDFREFSGFNPKEFLREEHDAEEGNFFPLDRDG